MMENMATLISTERKPSGYQPERSFVLPCLGNRLSDGHEIFVNLGAEKPDTIWS